MALPKLTLRNISLSFGSAPLLHQISASLENGDKVCLVGRNGSGKSTCLKICAGLTEPDAGDVFVEPGTKLFYLEQNPVVTGVSLGDYLTRNLAPEQSYQADILLDEIKLTAERDPRSLSGGEARRVAIANALLQKPDILLLDEPTNHLDIDTILWLEKKLVAFKGALVVISHDRRFLETISTKLWWLEQGQLRQLNQGFKGFEAWQEQVYHELETKVAALNTAMRQELHWLARGVTARRKRNMGRMRGLQALKVTTSNTKALQRDITNKVKITTNESDPSAQCVFEAKNISKSYGDKIIAQDFSTRIKQGDKIAFIGGNGAGKTTLLRLLLGQEAPDKGFVKQGLNVNIVYFDQHRLTLDPEMTLWDVLTDQRGDTIWVGGKPRHVVSYLGDFLFSENMARMPVKALSGGERNRLLLAKILAKESNCLVLDEPTNDLDMDTLDLLEDMLEQYQGTLLLVSHDRDFIDRLANRSFVIKGQGVIKEYAGGYSDYLTQSSAELTVKSLDRKNNFADIKLKPSSMPDVKTTDIKVKAKAKLSYKDMRELELLPGKIQCLEAEIAQIEGQLNDPNLYQNDPLYFQTLSQKLTDLQQKLEQAEIRWLELA